MAAAVLSLMAHPDDAEFLCAGTLARLRREQGWDVHVATMTPGDCGSAEMDAETISRVRRGEGAAAAAVLEGTYHCLEERDLLVFYGERTLEKAIRLFREVRPAIVITHSPADYMLDHEVTSTIARAAAFGAPIRNMFAGRNHPPALDAIPPLYYADPVEGKDPLGQPVWPAFCIDISGTLDVKREMLRRHASQRDWLMKHHGMDEYVRAMEQWSAERGRPYGAAAAEGFRQHLGHSYPAENIMGLLLGVLGEGRG